MIDFKNFTKGFLKENPTFVIQLGMCPTLGVTTSAINGIGMGLSTTFVLVMSNMAISLVKNVIPDKIRIPCYIVIIAAFVTIVDLMMAAYTPAVHSQLGIFIPLIVVNCIVLGRAEAFASKNSIMNSLLDGLGMGLGFTCALLAFASIREVLGNNSIFGYKIAAKDGILLFILPPGAFLVLGYLIALVTKINKLQAKKG